MELSREIGVSRNLLQRWKQLLAAGAETAVAASEDVVPASELRAAQQKIREHERLIVKQAVDLEILRAACDQARKDHAFTTHWSTRSSRRRCASAAVTVTGGRPRPVSPNRGHSLRVEQRTNAALLGAMSSLRRVRYLPSPRPRSSDG